MLRGGSLPALYWEVNVMASSSVCGSPRKCARRRAGQASLVLVLLALAWLPGCHRGKGAGQEVMYVSAPQAFLRDRVAPFYNKVGTVKNGDRVEVLDRDRRFAKVRTSNGVEGWVEQRHLVTQQIFDGFQKLKAEHQNDPVQAAGTTRNDTNLHIEPGRDTEHLYQLATGTKLSLLKRATAERTGGSPPANPLKKDNKPAGPLLEDWWLVRDDRQHVVGWVLGRMIDVDVPLDIAQYAEGQRFVGLFTLNEVKDGDKMVPQYLAIITPSKDGMPFDFDQVRVFTWNVKRHRYETAYREHGLNGVLPVTVTHETFDKEGDLPVFILRVKNDSGQIAERKYKLNSPIVRRVLAPGEQPPPKAVSRKKRR